MLIKELFKRDVTRNIPPVVYFHEVSPDHIAREVDEYIVTGGYKDGDHRKKRVERGIHEEYVRLLGQIVKELGNPSWSGTEPASWISGFYGSGKSSFAKMLGLALDQKPLPDGRSFEQVWLARDQTPLREELVTEWKKLRALVDPMAVIFDIGGSARDEPIHITILRESLRRFDYAADERVAAFELILEADAYYDKFLDTYERLHKQNWKTQGRNELSAGSAVSTTMHELQPERYPDPMSWRHAYIREKAFNMSANEVAAKLAHMVDTRGEGKTLFLVVDEMSQYVIGNHDRMLALQSFNSALATLRGKVWLLATGQQKLEEQDASTELGKLKSRFPIPFRVHLGEQNIREVVHKRLLEKNLEGEAELRALYEKNRTNLKLYAYDCDDITEEDFVEVYPLLPGHINLLLDITTQIRHRSTRVQGDSHSVRGLMQLLGDLFREERLAERPVGELVRFDDVYDIQATSLDVDTQRTMEKVRQWATEHEDEFALAVAKVVALLQLVQDQQPTTVEFVSACLYDRVDRGPTRRDDVRDALQRLREANPPLVSFSEGKGYRLESSARAEWNAERDSISVSSEKLFEAIKDRMQYLLDVPDRPRLKGVQLPYEARMTDSRGHADVWLKQSRGQATAPVDFRFLAQSERSTTAWLNRSGEEHYRDRLIWVAGDVESIDDAARRWARCQAMVRRKTPLRAQLGQEQQHLLVQEQYDEERAGERLQSAISDALMEGSFYFRGREIKPRELGDGFGTALEHAASSVLEDLYPHYTSLNISEGKLAQLFKPSLGGAAEEFMNGPGQLGILDYDAGQIVASCPGTIPQQLLRAITEHTTLSGSYVMETFAGIPYGYHSSVIKACLLGLLRGGHIEIRTRGGGVIKSYADPGTQDFFSGDRDIKTADFLPSDDVWPPPPKLLLHVAKLLDLEFKIQVEREPNAITEAIFKQFPGRVGQLREVRDLLAAVGCPVPPALDKLETALTACTSSRDVRGVVTAAIAHLDALRDGFSQLNVVRFDLDETAVGEIKRLRRLLATELAQLEELGDAPADAVEAGQRIRDHLTRERPWNDLPDLAADARSLRDTYVRVRAEELAATGAAIEEARNTVKMREDFDALKPDDKNFVLLPLGKILPDTDAESVTPTLTLIRSRRGIGLRDALAESQIRFDEIIGPFVVVKPRLHGRVISTQEGLDALLAELRESISEQLKTGKKVRLD